MHDLARRAKALAGVLFLEFTDAKGVGREHETFQKAHPIVARARRELMQEAIGKGVWGVNAETDDRWRAEIDRTPLPTEREGVPLLRNDLDEQQYARATHRSRWKGKAMMLLPAALLTEDGNVVPLVPERS